MTFTVDDVRCVDGFFPAADVVVTALQDIPDGYEANVVVRPVGWEEPGAEDWLFVRHLSLHSTGDTQQVLVDLPDPDAGVIWAEVRQSTYPYGDLFAPTPVTIPAPSCPLSPTAPTVTAEVARPASADEGGAIAVMITDPPGSPEYHVTFRVEWLDAPADRDYPHRNFSSWWRPGMEPEDGEQLVQVVDEFDGQSGDCCTDDPPPTLPDFTPLTLGPGRYRITYTWLVFVTGFEGAQEIAGAPFELTVPLEPSEQPQPAERAPLRVATFDVSLSRPAARDLVADLSTPDDPQAAAVAEIIQTTRPDVVLLGGFDLDADDEAVGLLRDRYLGVARHDASPIDYPYWFTAEVNVGEQSGFDLDRDGSVGGPGDAFGRGSFPGQAGMVVLSRFPIVGDEVRTFQRLLWASMPGARLPDDPATPAPADWFSADELAVVRLASASFWDVPIDVDGDVIHVLASAPATPGREPEDPATLRNADEIRFWADYIAPDADAWIVDDAGVTGGLAGDAEFVIAGDLNADPVDGDSVDGAIQQLVDLDRVQDPEPTSEGGVEAAELQAAANTTHRGEPALDTADLADDPAPGNLRADYVLPSAGLDAIDAGVFWPASDDPLARLVSGDPPTSSDHHLVWVDVSLEAATSVTTTAVPTTAAAPSTPADYGFDDFFDVPQLGNEAVRGTGCGGDGSIGDVIADGYWRGYVRSWDGATLEQSSALQFDLICIYLNRVGDQQYLDGWLVNNNERTRTVPIGPGFFAHGTTFVGDEVSAPFDQPDVTFDPNRQVWLRIVDGTAVWAVSSPDSAAPPTPPGTTTTQPDEAAALTADCAFAQHIVWEGDIYAGVEFPADGSPLTGDLLFAVEVSRDFFEHERTQMHSQLAQTAFDNYDAAWSAFVDGGVYTEAGFQATVEAGWAALAPLQQACVLPVSTS